MAIMIKNKVLIIISSKSNHVELIGNHYFGIYENSKRKYLDLASIFGAQSIEKNHYIVYPAIMAAAPLSLLPSMAINKRAKVQFRWHFHKDPKMKSCAVNIKVPCAAQMLNITCRVETNKIISWDPVEIEIDKHQTYLIL